MTIIEQPSAGEPTQTFGTAGIKPLTRPSLMTRIFMAVVAFVERLNLTLSKVGNPPIYDKAVFLWTRRSSASGAPFAPSLTACSRARMSCRASTSSPPTSPLSAPTAAGRPFCSSGYGFKSDANIHLCPQTWRICQNIPGLITVMFSILEPGKHLPPHRGPYNGVLRLHLGLIVPEPREALGIRVDREIYRWKEGEAVIFDDAYEHEAWNRTPHTRVVLFVDFRKPLGFPANLINWLMLNLAVFTPFIREGVDNEKAWEKKFYAEAEALRNGKARHCPGSPLPKGGGLGATP